MKKDLNQSIAHMRGDLNDSLDIKINKSDIFQPRQYSANKNTISKNVDIIPFSSDEGSDGEEVEDS